MTYIEKEKHQKTVHSLTTYELSEESSPLIQGARFHVLADHISIKGKPILQSEDYSDQSDDGFIGVLSKSVQSGLSTKIPPRRILQTGLEIIILRDGARRKYLHRLIRFCNDFLRRNFKYVLTETAHLYHIKEENIQFGLERFLRIYTPEMITITGSPNYRLSPIATALLGLEPSLNPVEIMRAIEYRPEIKWTVEQNIDLLFPIWYQELYGVAQGVLNEEGTREIVELCK